MADEDASKIDPKNDVDVKYDDIPEAHCQDFEAQLKQQAEEAKMKLLSSYWRTRNKVIKKAEFTMPSFPSTTSSTSMSNVSDLPSDFVGKLMAALRIKLLNKYSKAVQQD